MAFEKLKKVVSKAAPILGEAISEFVPGGGIAVRLIREVMGASDDSDEAKIVDAIKNDPQAAIKLQELQNKHKEALEEIALRETAAYLTDRQNARRRQTDSEKATGKRDYNLYALAWTVIVGFFALCVVLMKWSLPIGSEKVVFMLFGALSSGFGMVLQYFFGSSKSSSDKTSLLVQKNGDSE